MAQHLISLTNTLELILQSDQLPHFCVKEHLLRGGTRGRGNGGGRPHKKCFFAKFKEQFSKFYQKIAFCTPQNFEIVIPGSTTDLLISLYEKVKSLKEQLDILPNMSSEEQMNLLVSRIRHLAYITEDLVESANSDLFLDPECFWARFYPDFEDKYLEIAEFGSIVEELLSYKCRLQGLVPSKHLSVGSSRPDHRGNSMMVGFDEDMMILKDRLTGPESKLQSIPIVGMGGNGKTTLAINLYDDSLIKYHFDFRAFVTISQTYHDREVVLEILQCLGAVIDKPHKKSTWELKQILYKELYGRRYLLVLDDMWNTDVWDDLKMIFPDAVNGSRIILTTRLLDMAVYATGSSSSSPPHQISLLNEKDSWDLLCQKVFQRELECPPELEEIGRLISRNCRGLPLAISTIGGLLVNCSRTREFWKYVAENLNAIAMNADEHYSEILSLSYNHLPHHLKPCFLYFGLFPQDCDISAPRLIKLWIAEGFIQSTIGSKGLEEVAEEYLQGLIARNLVFVRSRGSNGKIRICGIHDILRDLCIKEAQNESFLHIINKDAQYSLEDMMYCHRLSIHLKLQEVCDIAGPLCGKFTSVPLRSLLFTSHVSYTLFSNGCLQLLRVLDISRTRYSHFPVEILLLLNLRYLAFTFCGFGVVPPQLSQLWKLQVLNLVGDLEKFDKLLFGYYHSYSEIDMPSEILQMTQLRDIVMPIFFLPDPIEGENSSSRIMPLETLYTVANFRCTDEFVKKFLNLRKLGIYYYNSGDGIGGWTDYHLENLVHLSKLENLKCDFSGSTWLRNLVFPQSLKKLTLICSKLLWDDMGIIGCLPNLEVLKLKKDAVIGQVWEPVEGEFRRLKFLLIDGTNLVKWIADETHFPCLEHLNIRWCLHLEEIPAGIGDIATLQRIGIDFCSASAGNSAMEILEEQRSMENHVPQVRVWDNFDLSMDHEIAIVHTWRDAKNVRNSEGKWYEGLCSTIAMDIDGEYKREYSVWETV